MEGQNRYLDCPSLGLDSSATGDTASRPWGPAGDNTIYNCHISFSIYKLSMRAHVGTKQEVFSMQCRRFSSYYGYILFFPF